MAALGALLTDVLQHELFGRYYTRMSNQNENVQNSLTYPMKTLRNDDSSNVVFGGINLGISS